MEHVNGGDGYIVRETMVTSEEVGEACKMYARIHLQPGCEVGYHEHHGETESYFILTGHGTYDDNGENSRQILAICSCVKTEMHMELRTPVMKNLPLWH
mgnify:FL=1